MFSSGIGSIWKLTESLSSRIRYLLQTWDRLTVLIHPPAHCAHHHRADDGQEDHVEGPSRVPPPEGEGPHGGLCVTPGSVCGPLELRSEWRWGGLETGDLEFTLLRYTTHPPGHASTSHWPVNINLTIKMISSSLTFSTQQLAKGCTAGKIISEVHVLIIKRGRN